MINLLPTSSRREAIWEYRRRLFVAAEFFLALLGVVGMLALIPSYLQAGEVEHGAVAQAAFALESIADPALTGAAASEEKDAQLVSSISKSLGPRPSGVLDLFVARHSGVILHSLAYTSQGGHITVTLGGVAGTRDDLLAFRNTLQQISGVSGADFPAADLAASSTIPFSIKMKYTPPFPRK